MHYCNYCLTLVVIPSLGGTTHFFETNLIMFDLDKLMQSGINSPENTMFSN